MGCQNIGTILPNGSVSIFACLRMWAKERERERVLGLQDREKGLCYGCRPRLSQWGHCTSYFWEVTWRKTRKRSHVMLDLWHDAHESRFLFSFNAGNSGKDEGQHKGGLRHGHSRRGCTSSTFLHTWFTLQTLVVIKLTLIFNVSLLC